MPENVDLFVDAVTHRSYRGSIPGIKDYERLETLGDSFISLIITEYLYKDGLPLRDISGIRNSIVSGKILSWLSKELEIDKYLRIGKGCNVTDSILEDVYESLIGACYLTMGYVKTKEIVKKTLYENYLEGNLPIVVDYKTQLQELIQNVCRENKISYFLEKKVRSSGGREIFSVHVKVGDSVLGKGNGFRLKEAEQEAAREALIKFKSFV